MAVEFALILPMFMALIFGTITVSFTFSDHLAVSNAVREGSRFGAATDYSQPGWATSVRDRVKQAYLNSGSEVTDAQICVRLRSSTGLNLASWDGASCGAEPDSPASLDTGSCVSKVWARMPARIELIVSSPLIFDVGASSVAYYGRTVGSCSAE